MLFEDQKTITRRIIIICSFIVVVLIVWNTNSLFRIMKNEERVKMEGWVVAQYEIQQNSTEDNISELAYWHTVHGKLNSPMIIVDKNDSIVNYDNIDSIKIARDPNYIYKILDRIKKDNDPIIIDYDNFLNQRLYYGDSSLLKKLTYFPIALVLIIVLFATVTYFFYRTSKISEQNKLWAGMAKETAHQIGTPLSSLLGWIEILRSQNVEESTLVEINKDVERLQTITERFSQIGSIPKLERTNIITETTNTFNYLKMRSSKLITFELLVPEDFIYVNLNSQLFSWTIENLVKNAIDAMKGKGLLRLVVKQRDKEVKIQIIDTGKGIPRSQFYQIFEPGFTSKKRGWGLGLSLAKRIVEDYHQGKLRVSHSEIGKGTTMEIVLNIID
ncbi:sensor histidine kinase [Spongiivirga citrea]|uniref:histidine kinase n=1 Tax=Spongiivirga citrea TaxID=1481457 RepID=A0A6M0CGG6_9FLAO|nr:HAMP domain-containing sensor histidine kinase [Spongiivirga citrea]NER16988.1 sensor histidine kinase [Spongiivirga citrea]